MNGNKNSQGLRLVHWNKENSSMSSKLNDIKQIISTHRPHCLGISEANIKTNQDIKLFSIDDYNIFLAPPSLSGIVRLAVYVHKDMVVKLRQDLMSPELSSVWLEAGLKNQKKILINQMYREWQQLGVQDSINITEQLTRWSKYLDLWETALCSGREVISLGDYNINHCNWMDQNVPRSSQTYKLKSLISALFTRIFPHGISQLVSGPTRHFPGQKPSGLDHLYTNVPEKISAVSKYFCRVSNHMITSEVRKVNK